MGRLAVMAFTGILVLEASAANLTGSWRFIGNPDLGVGAAYIGQNPGSYVELSCDVTGSGLEMVLAQSLYGRPLPGEGPVQLILIVPGRGTYALPFRRDADALVASLGADHPLIGDLRNGVRLELRTAAGEEVSRASLSGSSWTIDQLLEFCARPAELR